MDIISIQIANKVLRRMNTEYNGLYETVVAVAGQRTFYTTRPFGANNNLKVYVDGVRAVKDRDYVHVDDTTVRFHKGLEEGTIVLITNEVVGIPRYEVHNPAYDDTVVKTDITSIKNRTTSIEESLNTINTVLDENGDGILDAIVNLKQQWLSSEGDLQTLITNKANQADLDSVLQEIVNARGTSLTLTEEISSIKNYYSGLQIAERVIQLENFLSQAAGNEAHMLDRLDLIEAKANGVTALKTEIEAARGVFPTLRSKIDDLGSKIEANADDSALISRIEAVENSKLDSFIIVDNITGWEYQLVLSGAALSVDLLHKLAYAVISRIGSGAIYKGDSAQFKVVAKTEKDIDVSDKVDVVFSLSDETVAIINPSTGLLSALEAGSVNIMANATLYGISQSAIKTINIVLTDVQTLEKAKAELDLAELNGLVNLTNVTGDLVFPNLYLDTNIGWASSNVSIITETGIVNRPAPSVGDSDIVITAELSKGQAIDYKVFNVRVIALPWTDQSRVQYAYELIEITNPEAIITNIALPTLLNDCNIVWASSNLDVITDNGTVTRPTAGSANANVTLTATITYGSHQEAFEFFVIVLAEEPTSPTEPTDPGTPTEPEPIVLTDQEKVDLAYDSLTLGDISAIAVDFIELPSMVDSVAVTWVSSDPTVIDQDGFVIRPEFGNTDATVTLTATLTYGTATRDKLFQATVLAQPAPE